MTFAWCRSAPVPSVDVWPIRPFPGSECDVLRDREPSDQVLSGARLQACRGDQGGVQHRYRQNDFFQESFYVGKECLVSSSRCAAPVSVLCECGHRWCFSCMEPPHLPLPCEYQRLWKEKTTDGGYKLDSLI